MTATPCAICGRPTPDGYVDTRCTDRAAGHLSALGVLAQLLIVALLVAVCCGMPMYITGRDNACTDAGGRLEFSTQRWSGEVCVRDGQVINP